MNLFTAIRSEWQKVKHTSFWTLHIIMSLAGALLFTLYFNLYDSVEDERKLRLILELTAMTFPLLISAAAGLNLQLEERAAHMQMLLFSSGRRRTFLGKLIALYGAGVLSFTVLSILFFMGTGLTGQSGAVMFAEFLQSAVGLAWNSFVLYIVHLFFSLKFGTGFSLFWGVFESLQCIIYSNVELYGAARYIPFAWGMNWIHDVLNHTFLRNLVQWIVAGCLTAGLLLAAVQWFAHWEGRKHEE